MNFPRENTARASLSISEESDRSLFAPLFRILSRLRDRASIKGLLSLEDEHLDDIGLKRKDVLAALYGRSDPSEYLRQQAKKRRLIALSSRIKI